LHSLLFGLSAKGVLLSYQSGLGFGKGLEKVKGMKKKKKTRHRGAGWRKCAKGKKTNCLSRD